MHIHVCHFRTWTTVILLLALVVPRCLMASDVTYGIPVEADRQAPCHGMQEQAGPAQTDSLITCAQQCEQSLASSILVKKTDPTLPDHFPAVIVSTHTSVISSLTSSTLHQGWPPDNRFLLANTPHLYLDTGRLRL